MKKEKQAIFCRLFSPRVVPLKLLNTVVVQTEQWKPIIDTESDVNFSAVEIPVVNL